VSVFALSSKNELTVLIVTFVVTIAAPQIIQKTPMSCDVKIMVYSTDTNTTQKYHLIKDMKTWQEAQSYCRENHTDLISGTKQLQDGEVEKVIKSTHRKPFFGLFRDTWRWSDGSSFSFRHWNLQFTNYQPNRGQCAKTKFDDKGRWMNESCDVQKPFICYDGE
uniref:C-type lectin domain-containing protein n=1 Tax=Xiphophorus maculatus TaxID=8083 RepID=A0A3B5RE94_XIPMA